LFFIGRFEEARFRRGRHVDTALSKSDGQGTRTVLIQVELYRPRHWLFCTRVDNRLSMKLASFAMSFGVARIARTL
jgi:hypothetical protein